MLIAVRANYELAVEVAEKVANDYKTILAIKRCIYGRNDENVEYQVCELSDLMTTNSRYYCQTIYPKEPKIKLV